MSSCFPVGSPSDIPLLPTVIASNGGRSTPLRISTDDVSILELCNQGCSLLLSFGLPLFDLLLVLIVEKTEVVTLRRLSRVLSGRIANFYDFLLMFGAD